MTCKEYTFKSILLLLIIIMAGAGCGYKFSGGGALPSGSGVICISIFKNRSSEARFENIIVNDLIYEFKRNGQQITDNEDGADSVLSGEIKSVLSGTVTHTDSLTSVESRVVVVADVWLKDQKGRVIWDANNIKDNEVYTVDSDNEAESMNRKAALKKLSRRFSSMVYARMTDNF